MKATLHLGRIGGVAVRLHASWFLVLVLVGWGLAAGVFPAEAPGWPPAAYLSLAMLTALVYLGSVLLHELGHAWVAAREGVPVQDVTLYFFGGAARLGPLPPLVLDSHPPDRRRSAGQPAPGRAGWPAPALPR